MNDGAIRVDENGRVRLSLRVRRWLRKYCGVLVVTLQTGLAYPMDTFARTSFMIVTIFVFIQLWTVALGSSDTVPVAGYDLPGIVWYLVLTETIILSCPRLFTQIDQQVKESDLAYALNRPYSYALFQYASYLGNALLLLPVNFVAGALLAYALVGAPPVPLVVWPAIALAVVLAITLNFAVELVIGLLAFWFEDTYAFFWIYQKIVFTLGGLFLPLDLFPDVLRRIAENLPFNAIAYAPARLVATFEVGMFANTIGTQVLWLVVLGVIAAAVYQGGVQRVNINGG